MTGRPNGKFRKALNERIRLKGGFSVIYERIASGETITAIARDYDVSRSYFQGVLSEGERRQILQQAKTEAATSHAEAALEIADGISEDASREQVKIAEIRINQRKWMASKLDRDMWGETPMQVNIPMTFGSQFLAALKTPPPKRELPAPAVHQLSSGAEPPAVEAHIIPEEPVT